MQLSTEAYRVQMRQGRCAVAVGRYRSNVQMILCQGISRAQHLL